MGEVKSSAALAFGTVAKVLISPETRILKAPALSGAFSSPHTPTHNRSRFCCALQHSMPSLKERAKTLIELIAGSYFIFADRPLEIETKAEALLTDDARALITKLRGVLEAVSPWSAETTEAAMSKVAICSWGAFNIRSKYADLCPRSITLPAIGPQR